MSRGAEQVRLYDLQIAPGETVEVEQWALRYTDGQTLVQMDRAKAERAHAQQDNTDPCVVVTRTITVTNSGWSQA